MGLISMKFMMNNIGPQRMNPNLITMTFTEHIHAPQEEPIPFWTLHELSPQVYLTNVYTRYQKWLSLFQLNLLYIFSVCRGWTLKFLVTPGLCLLHRQAKISNSVLEISSSNTQIAMKFAHSCSQEDQPSE